MPATPPARNAIFTASRNPDSRAALAVRTLARTASHMPTYPVTAENPAPRMNAIERPNLIENPECTASSETGRMKNSATPMMTTKMLKVRNWRDR